MQKISIKKKRKIKNAILRNNFYLFFKETFHSLNNNVEFYDNWHMHYLANILEETLEGKYKNIIINVPPRSLKSTMVSIAWPAWILGKYPEKKIICASYSSTLSTKLSTDCRNIIKTKWYKEAFENFKLSDDQNCKEKYSTTQNGFRFATSISGSLIGEGGDILICDDPLSPEQANSQTYRDKVFKWYMESFTTRLNDKKNGIRIIVMQRLNDDDLCGRIIKEFNDEWKIIKIPAVANQDYVYSSKTFYKFFAKNQILNSQREDINQLNSLKKQLGVNNFASQYMQQPIPNTGYIIKKEWLHTYEKLPDEYDLIVQSWDIALTINKNSDYSVCSTWMISKNKYYLVEISKNKLNYLSLLNKIQSLYFHHQAHYVIIEDTTATKALIETIQKNPQMNISKYRPISCKKTRLTTASPAFETGQILIPKKAKWIEDFLHEILNFPNCKHDDQVDSVSQFILYANKVLSKTQNRYIRVM